MKAFLMTAQDIAAQLESDLKNGLTDEKASENKLKYGENSFSKEKGRPFILKFFDSFKEPMLVLLLIAGGIALAVNIIKAATGGEPDFIECAGIFIAIALSVIITVVMEGRSEKAFEEINKIKDDINVKVTRNGRTFLLPQAEIAAGDVITIETGDRIPADARVIACDGLRVDESALTGESEHVKKDAQIVFTDEKTPVAERRNMVYSGCFVTAGSARCIVCAVGDSTEFGAIARELSKSETKSTPLQEKLKKLGKTIAILGAAAAAAVFIIQAVRMGMAGNVSADVMLEVFLTSIILLVAAVPEGLPTIVAVALALNIIKMAKEKALVRKLAACETIGGINIICSDKTGTLTKNKMTATNFYTDGKMISAFHLKKGHIANNICINSTANIETNGEKTVFVGNPTECALLAAQRDAKLGDYSAVRESFKAVKRFPFSSETKNMTGVFEKDGKRVAYTKGSPEKIIAFCSYVYENDEALPLTDEKRDEIEKLIEDYQAQACRVIAFAHKEGGESLERGDLESEMVYDGFVTIQDPLRTEVYDAVSRCGNAGISLKMLTGDNIVTAKAIASNLGMLNDGRAVEAREIEELPDDEFEAVLPEIRVIARSTPSVKLRVVKTLKKQGNTVAVTGDGINDAPAIKNADVGIAMGISGTEVSKEASDIVLLDDSFATIVKAVSWGRGIYENFQRFIQFQLTVNLSSVLIVLASVAAGLAAPFTALQLLWVNLIMDGPPALTLGLEPVHDDMMSRPPTPRGESILSPSMRVNIIVNGLLITAVCLCQQFFNFLGAAAEEQSSVIFTLFVLFQLMNAFNARELKARSIFAKGKKNSLMLIVLAATFALQVIITQFGGSVFATAPLGIVMWLKIIASALSVIVISEIVKLIRRLAVRGKAI